MHGAVLAALVSLTFAGAVRAQESSDDTRKAAALDEARQHVAKAKVHYDLGEFKEAADEYIQVYRLRPIPAILFNVAQAYRQGGLYEKARQFYKSYLRESPDAKNRAMIEKAIREMDEMTAKERRTKEKPPNGVKEPAEASLPIQEKTAQKQAPPQKEGTKPLESPKPAEVAAAKPPSASPQSVSVAPPAAPPQGVDLAPSTVPPQSVTVAPAKPAAVPGARSATVRPAVPAVAMAGPRPSAPTAATHSTPAPAAMEEDEPLYKKWWLWTAVGVVAVGAGVAAKSLGGNAPPGSHFGNTPVFP